MAWKLLVGASVAILGGCGVIYTSPGVSAIAPGSEEAEALGYAVEVRPLTMAVALEANAAPFVSRGLPDYFYPERLAARGAPGAGVGLPQPTARASAPLSRDIRLPPPLQASPYRIGVGDALSLGGPGIDAADPQRRDSFVVQEDGAIALPGIGRVVVGGRTVDEAQDALFQAFAAAGRDPSLTFEISGFNSQFAVVGGAVTAPGIVPVTLQPLLLDEAIQRAGGIAPSDLDGAVVRLFRDGTAYQIPASDLLGGRALAPVPLVDGDRVFVDVDATAEDARRAFDEMISLRRSVLDEQISVRQGRLEEQRQLGAAATEARAAFASRIGLESEPRDFAYLTGEALRPSRLPLPYAGSMSLADALYFNQGFPLSTADSSEVYLIRRPPATSGGPVMVTAYHLDASNAANMSTATVVQLRPDDVVFIAEQPVTVWNRIISQILPGASVGLINAINAN